MSRSAQNEGLPEWLFTWRMAALSGIGVGVIGIIAMGLFFTARDWWSDATETAPACFAHFVRPIVPGSRPFSTSDRMVELARSRHDTLIQRVLKAEEACTPERCTGVARTAYQKAIKSYIDEKSHTITQLDTIYGAAGLQWGLEYYGQVGDNEVARGFRTRYAAGHVPLETMPRFHDAARLILYRPAVEFLPCRRSST